jgi:hypothetical protein
MKVELFVLDPATRMVDLNKEWISTIKEFKKILSRDRASKGDMDGRRKLQATKEFTFIYHFCDYASKFGNYSEEDKFKQCVANSELPENFDYKKDEELLTAMAKYKEMQETPALKVLNEAKEGLHSAHRVIRKIRLHLETELASIDLTKPLEEDDEGEDEGGNRKKKKADPISKITTALKNLMALTNEVSPALKTLKELEEEVKKELGDKTGLRGDREKGMREDSHIKLPSREAVEEESQSTGKAGMFADI